MKSSRQYRLWLIVAALMAALFAFAGCGGTGNNVPGTKKTPAVTSSVSVKTPAASPSSPKKTGVAEKLKDGDKPDEKGFSSTGIVKYDPPKKDSFTRDEIQEIKKDGYLAYFYRRKYHPMEIKVVWDSVNTLFPDYSRRQKLQATRSILAYHWVVYRTTFTHNMFKNVAITKKYRSLIKQFAKIHQVPAPMVEGVITWENSGGLTKESWAACVGVGQLSKGAVQVAHSFYDRAVSNLHHNAKMLRKGWLNYQLPMLGYGAQRMLDRAKQLNVRTRHREMAKKQGVKDDRLIPECNVEDAVIYLKLLYHNYNKRIDLAISAYHNGGLNNNDIIRDYLNRRQSNQLGTNARQKEIMAGILEKDLKFVSLWEDSRSRDMLNGLRTVYGNRTTPANRLLSLGDESDIYPWKVAAAYGALNADEKVLQYLVDKYNGLWDVVELSGLRVYDDVEKIRQAIRNHWLVPMPKVYKDKGIAGLKDASAEYRKRNRVYNYYIGPELAGFLIDLSREYRRRTGNYKLKIPIRRALESRILEIYNKDKIPDKSIPHLTGYAVEIDLANADNQPVLYGILKEWYLYDRIYFINRSREKRVTVNPRFGKYYYNVYRDYVIKQRKKKKTKE